MFGIDPLAFVLVAAFVALAVHLLSYALLRRLPDDVHERTVNQLFGLLPGLANGLITAAIVASVLLSIPLGESFSERVRASALVNRLSSYTERLETALHPVFGDAIAQTLNLLTVQPARTNASRCHLLSTFLARDLIWKLRC